VLTWVSRKEEKRLMTKDNKEKKWESPKMLYVGDVADVLQGGTGKLPVSPEDPGESRKPPDSDVT
jgi:hypothetical protein